MDHSNKKISIANKGRKPKGYIRTEAHRQQLRDRMQGNDKGTKITTELKAEWDAKMTPEQRKDRAKNAAAARWEKEAPNFTSG